MRWWILIFCCLLFAAPSKAEQAGEPAKAEGPAVCDRFELDHHKIHFYYQDKLILTIKGKVARKWQHNQKKLGLALAVKPVDKVERNGTVVLRIIHFKRGTITTDRKQVLVTRNSEVRVLTRE